MAVNETIVSSVSGMSCCGFGCAGIRADIVPRDPTSGELGTHVRIPNPTGQVRQEKNRIGTADITLELCDCVELFAALNAAGIDAIGEWGHELWVYRDCEDDPIHVGPIVGLTTDQIGTLTIFSADRLVWLGETSLRSDLFGTWTVADAIRDLFEQAETKNISGAILDQNALARCVDSFQPEFGVSDCRSVLDWWLDMADSGLFCFSMVGARLHIGCPNLDLAPLYVRAGNWNAKHVPTSTNGFELATRVCVKSSTAEDLDGNPIQECFPPDDSSAVDDFYGCHEHVEESVPFSDRISLQLAARRIWQQRRRTPRLVDSIVGFGPSAPFCAADMVPGRAAFVETSGHLPSQELSQMLSTMQYNFVDGKELAVAPSFTSGFIESGV